MMVAALTDFTTDIIADLPGCPSPYVTRLLKRVIREFCKRTHCDQADDTISVVAATQTYTLSNPVNKEIIALTKVEDEDEYPYSAYFFDPLVFKLNDSPSEAFTLNIRYALRPTTATTSIDDIIYNNYYEGIIAGVKAKAKAEHRKTWYDPIGAESSRKLYEFYVRKAKNDLSRQFSNKDQRIKLFTWV
jgi:hypothetical protein